MAAFMKVDAANRRKMAVLGIDVAGVNPLAENSLQGVRHVGGGFAGSQDKDAPVTMEGEAVRTGMQDAVANLKEPAYAFLRIGGTKGGAEDGLRVAAQLWFACHGG
jgi:hypothetical protein